MKSLLFTILTALTVLSFYFWSKPIAHKSAQLAQPMSMVSSDVSKASDQLGTAVVNSTTPAIKISARDLDPQIESQIKHLSQRDNTQAQAVEIRPGVFLTDISVIHQSVTVATLNADGTVQLTEH